MSQERKKYTTESLVELGAVDTASRSIKRTDRIDVRCYLCSHVDAAIPLAQVIAKHKITAHGWRCRECFKKAQSMSASLRTGEKNPFYGKKHTKEAADKRHIAYKEWVKNNSDKVRENAEKARVAFTSKHGVHNPMDDEEIRKQHKEVMNSEELVEIFKQNMNQRYESQEERDKAGQKAKEYFQSSEGEERKNALSLQWAEKNRSSKEWNDKRLAALLPALQKMFEDPKERYRLIDWVIANPDCLDETKPEREIREFVQSLGIQTEKLHMGRKEVDIYSRDHKIGIEHNGVYFHNDTKVKDTYHIEKADYFLSKGIRIIQIWDLEWYKRKDQIKSFLRSCYGKNETIVGARKCEFREIDSVLAKELCEKWHIQGAPHQVEYAIAAYYKDEPVAVATFAKHHRGLDETVLTRMCCKESVTVTGFLSKVTKMASNKFQRDITSWADRRFSNGDGYLATGWEQLSISGQDYSYTNFRKIISKQSRRKDVVNTPEWMTESQHAVLDGLFKLWDCGKIKFIYRYSPKVFLTI